jgi:two-component system, LytTR family, response regulator
MTMSPVTLIVADDERPARKFLTGLLKSCAGAQLVGEAASGEEALSLIQAQRPHLALLDLQMPELGGLEVVRRLPPTALPLVAFVTAFDDHAIEAFELNAIDYLLKPVDKERLASTLERARARTAASPAERTDGLRAASTALDLVTRRRHLERIPVRREGETVLLAVRQIISIVAEGELLHLTTAANDRFTIAYRLHALESRLDPRRFVRLSRGAVVAVDAIERFSPMPGGTYQVQLNNGQSLVASRIQSRILRETLLRI